MKKQSNGTARIVFGSIGLLLAGFAILRAFALTVAADSDAALAPLAIIFWGGIGAWLLISGMNSRKLWLKSDQR